MTNDTLQAIARRYSCRAFTSKAPSDEQAQAIAAAAIAAPSAMNLQPWHIVMIKDTALIEEMDAEALRILQAMEDKSAYERIMGRGGRVFYNAPCMALVLAETGKPSAPLDCGIVCENIALAAASMGLGNVLCGMAAIPFSGEKGTEFKKRCGFPEGFDFGCSVLFGYSAKEAAPHVPDEAKVSWVKA